MKKFKESKILPKYIEQSVITEMLDKARNEQKKFSYRNYIILMTLARTGMRSADIANLKKQDIQRDSIIVRQGKGKKDRVIPLDHDLGNLLGLYADRLSPNDRIFNIKIRQIRNVVYKYATDKSIHPHTYRHSFAVHCIKSGMNIRSLQKILGHSDLATTAVYLDLVGKDVIDDFKKVEW